MRLLTILIISCFGFINCFDKDPPKCEDNKECGKCIGFADNKCVWCSQVNVAERCKSQEFYIDDLNRTAGPDRWCDDKYVVNPKSEMHVVKNNTFDAKIQLRPQHIKIKARPGETVNFEMAYQPAKQFPLDVYFLMDYSFTMRAHKTALKNQVNKVYAALKNLTNNVLLGVGSFVEKPGFPYADVMAEGSRRQFAYSFRNHLPLTDDMAAFEEAVEKSKFGSNYDDPESSLDALLQVMACEKQINWRNGTRRIIVLATDSTYHSAGDGKMIGAVKPNDMKCRMTKNEYNREASLTYDYPSVSQINKLATEGKFKIIFAVLKEVDIVYKRLSSQIMGSEYAELKSNSSSDKDDDNIRKLIEDSYNDSVEKVELDFNVDPIIKINLGCTSKTPSDECKISPSQLTVIIPGNITALDCPPKGANNYEIYINHLRINDKLKIEFEIDCQCECEKKVDKTISAECSNQGIKQCGGCKCNKERSGPKCELNCADTRDYSACNFQPNSIHPCSGHGNCECGKCSCKTGYSGEFCQYNDLNCPKPNNFICSGHGKCKFEKCVCSPPWTGEGCDCSMDTTLCIGAFSKKVCSGRGECNCGRCECNKIPNSDRQYLGAYCDSCDECAQERCDELKDYVHCVYNKDKEVCDTAYHQDNQINIRITRLDKAVFNSTEMLAIKCETELDDGKILVFKYDAVSDTKQLRIIIQNELEPASKADMWVIIGSVVGGILLAGILALIAWKIIIDKYDAREYEKFCESARAQGYDVSQNPLYEGPNVNFNNPTFRCTDK